MLVLVSYQFTQSVIDIQLNEGQQSSMNIISDKFDDWIQAYQNLTSWYFDCNDSLQLDSISLTHYQQDRHLEK